MTSNPNPNPTLYVLVVETIPEGDQIAGVWASRKRALRVYEGAERLLERGWFRPEVTAIRLEEIREGDPLWYRPELRGSLEATFR